MNQLAKTALRTLLEGNRRFVNEQPKLVTYNLHSRQLLAKEQKPIACVITCSDSRITPEIILDQPLGSLLVCRVPGNVASESAKWCVEIAISNLDVSLVVVIGHTGCVAVKSVLEGTHLSSGATLRLNIFSAIRRVSEETSNIFERAIIENVLHTVEQLKTECPPLRDRVASGAVECIPMIYDMESGIVSIINSAY